MLPSEVVENKMLAYPTTSHEQTLSFGKESKYGHLCLIEETSGWQNELASSTLPDCG